jgi:UrcA family protein
MNVSSQKVRLLGSVVAAAATLCLAAGAQAGDREPALEQKNDDVVVRYADLNLESTEGARRLYARLATAADRACGYAPKSHALDRLLPYMTCYESTLDRAVEQIGSRQVRALHAARLDDSVG